jgi:DNA-binding transcriptional LysR family regulator
VPSVLMRGMDDLEIALDDWKTEPRNLYAVYPSRTYLPARTTAFVRFLRSRLAGKDTSRSVHS